MTILGAAYESCVRSLEKYSIPGYNGFQKEENNFHFLLIRVENPKNGIRISETSQFEKPGKGDDVHV